MSKAGELLNSSKKIVLKIGSNVLTGESGEMEMSAVENIAIQVKKLIDLGKHVVIVSSGAEVSGISAIGMWSRQGDINYKQAMCAIGQVELMMAYKKYFSELGIVVGQLLLTRRDFADSNCTLNIRNTLFTLIDEGVVPIINENDSVSVDEITLGDNDKLAALTCNLWSGDMLILMSDIDGLYDRPPGRGEEARLIHEVTDIESLRRVVEISGKSSFGKGGMESKIAAAEEIRKYGVPMLLVNGKAGEVLMDVLSGSEVGTIFYEEGDKR